MRTSRSFNHKNVKKIILYSFLFLILMKGLHAQTSEIIYKDGEGKLNYISSNEGNRIPDFSFAGYKAGETSIPYVPIVKSISPVVGDNTDHIQKAINYVSNLPLDKNGVRGALFLSKGTYEVYGKLYIKASGVVLRGEGYLNNDKNNTIIYSPNGKNIGETVINIEGNKLATNFYEHQEGDPFSAITNEFLPVNSRSFKVENASAFKVNDTVVVHRQATDIWMAMIDYGGTNGDDFWKPNEFEMKFPRRIIGINKNTLILDQPIYEHIYDKKITPSYIYKLNTDGFIYNVGLENLKVTIGYNPDNETDEDHAKNAIFFNGVWNCWAKNVTTEHFVFAGFLVATSNHITLDSCMALNPKSKITGGRRYNFVAIKGANNLLCKNGITTNGRHGYTSNGTSYCSGLVFLDCKSTGTYSSIEGHRRWTPGMLYDNLSIEESNTLGDNDNPSESTKGRVFGLYNRGNFGTGHGWSASHSIIWNSKSTDYEKTRFTVQKPPTSQNYAMFCDATVTGLDYNYGNMPGHIEGTKEEPQIQSLYKAQLKDRLQFGLMPDPPAKLATKIVGNKLKISWLDNSGEENAYVIEYSSDRGNNYNVLKKLKPNTTSYCIKTKKLMKDQKSYFQIYSIANGRKSSQLNFTFSY